VRGAGGRGTLFLDDVGDLSPALQGELLRILRDSESDPKASERAQLTRVRVIAASNIDLGEAANRGRFRHDLLYRLNIASVKVLPLRQRPGDIVPLAHHFLRLHSENGRLPVRVLGQDSVAALRHYPWPGNVRELENVIRFALLTATRRELSAVDLHLEHERASGPVIDRELSAQALDSTLDRLAGLLATLLQHPCARLYDKVEGLLIAEAYRATGGNQVHTATRLGISRNVVRTLLKKHGLLSPTRRHRP
jgi:DNA-binding NtrC family response regulator